MLSIIAWTRLERSFSGFRLRGVCFVKTPNIGIPNTCRISSCTHACKTVFNLTTSRRITRYCIAEDFNLLKTSLYMFYWGSIYSRYTSNSEANASELLEYLEHIVTDSRDCEKCPSSLRGTLLINFSTYLW